MSAFIALLRGVNLGGNKQVAMADLKALLEKMGFGDVRTLLNSGNVVFAASKGSPDKLERQIETGILKLLKVSTEIHVRTLKEWKAIMGRNPFPREAERSPSQLLVSCFRNPPTAAGLRALEAAITGREKVRVSGREAFIFYPEGQGRSRLRPDMVDKHLGKGTARNWNTVSKLLALAEG